MSSPLSFRHKLEARIAAVNSLLCVGLDPHEKELNLPLSVLSASSSSKDDAVRCDATFSFCKALVDATAPYVCCYKPNAAFFEALGEGGMECLRRVCRDVIPSDIPILLDVKRGDIGTTASAYATACYDYIGADAVTLSPLMGWDSISPFVTGTLSALAFDLLLGEKFGAGEVIEKRIHEGPFLLLLSILSFAFLPFTISLFSFCCLFYDTGSYASRGVFLLCKTSNPGSNDFLNLCLSSNELLYERIACLVSGDWTDKADAAALLGLVVGATDVVAMKKARATAGDAVWILAPGVGAQGGDLVEACQSGFNQSASGLLFPVSRGISTAADPGMAAKDLCEQIQSIRESFLASKADASTEKTDVSASGESDSIRPYQKEFIEFCLQQGVLKFGSFVLKSGRTSPYFFNAGLFSSGFALYRLGKAFASTIMGSPIL